MFRVQRTAGNSTMQCRKVVELPWHGPGERTRPFPPGTRNPYMVGDGRWSGRWSSRERGSVHGEVMLGQKAHAANRANVKHRLPEISGNSSEPAVAARERNAGEGVVALPRRVGVVGAVC